MRLKVNIWHLNRNPYSLTKVNNFSCSLFYSAHQYVVLQDETGKIHTHLATIKDELTENFPPGSDLVARLPHKSRFMRVDVHEL